MSRPFDWEQREQARDLGHSYIVQAPAGSGKTELLTQRMLGLLAIVENPEEVIAITFTRKAAAEMSQRLLGHLRAAQRQLQGIGDEKPLEPHEKISRELALGALQNDTRQGWNLIQQPSRLRIRTIDSLCGELARQLPILSRLGGGQQILEDANPLYRLAATRTLAAIEEDRNDLKDDVIRVLDRYDNQYDKLTRLLTGMLANREQWTQHLLVYRKGDGFDRYGLEEALRLLIELQLEKAQRIIPMDLLAGLPRLFRYAISNDAEQTSGLQALLDACVDHNHDVLELPKTAGGLAHWQTMIDMLLVQAGTMRKAAGKKEGFLAPSQARGEERQQRQAMKDDFQALLEKHADNEPLLEVFRTVRNLPSPTYEDEAWESLESLMRILLQAAQNLKLVMAESGDADYSEIAYRAIEALGFEEEPTDLALRMDYRIQHLLVDEFQDTSSSQVRLLKLLTAGWSEGDGRTLFLVGDPMQSIYRFRKAEVSLFIKAWLGELFDHIQLVPLQLSVNFRSTAPVVAWVNEVFPAVMPPKNDTVMGAVSYSEAASRPGVPEHGEVSLSILPQPDEEEEARRVIEVISSCDPQQSIAILVRSRRHASAILAGLDELKIDQPRYRYQAIRFTPLADTTPIRDLVSLTLALLQPADRLAWLSTLRAPYIGLELSDLDHLVAGDAGNTIVDAIRADGGGAAALSSDARQRLQRVAPIILEAINRRGRQPTRSVVESCWIELGGPACLHNDSELDDAATYFDLLDAMEAESLPIDRDSLDLHLKELFAEPDADASGNLQVLTIHSAKGLQFDTVILPGLNSGSGGDNSKLLHWFELPGEGIVMSPMRNSDEKEKQKKSSDLIQFISGVEKQREELENGRLLYVAATRAVHNLYLFAAVKPTAKGMVKPSSSTLMGTLWPAVQKQQEPLILEAANEFLAGDEAPVDEEAPSAALAYAQLYRRLACDWKLPEPPASVRLVETTSDEARDYIEFDWAGEDARLTGNLVHRLLQVIGEQGLEAWLSNGGMSRHLNWCRQQLASLGVKANKAGAIIDNTVRAIDNSLASERGQWILADHEDARCEHRITALLKNPETGGSGQTRNLVLDRTFVENGIRWIIDYKTSMHSGGDLEGFLENEAERYREQLQVYRQAMALTETLPIRTALYFPMLDRFRLVEHAS